MAHIMKIFTWFLLSAVLGSTLGFVTCQWRIQREHDRAFFAEYDSSQRMSVSHGYDMAYDAALDGATPYWMCTRRVIRPDGFAYGEETSVMMLKRGPFVIN